MNRLRKIKLALVCVWLVSTLLVLTGAVWSRGTAAEVGEAPAAPAQQQPTPSDDYVGTDTCAGCHDQQHAHFLKTPHAVLERDPGWKGKVTGCESCHGQGKAHVELMSEALGNGTDPHTLTDKRIRLLANEPPKQAADTCLQCHAGREEHNSYRQGEHWRNDVACTDCHFGGRE